MRCMWKVIPMMFLASFLSFGTSVWGNALAQEKNRTKRKQALVKFSVIKT